MGYKGHMQARSKLTIGLSVLLVIAISILTLTPMPSPQLGSISNSDKVYHALGFAALVLPTAVLRPRWLIVVVPIYAAFGGIIEIIQPFVGRDRSAADWIADLAGIGVGCVVGRAGAAVVSMILHLRPRQAQ
ncbi:VanZ family protein [Paracoccus rhizosphaerae]|uniref:Teicoplanin resistance protein VanZ n=1 Tax=Paracoccus rhizosphaerae TaxID=1133347 RepID=A0ABV6CHV7_9RHOB|nr:teicoplanin resistance protein VanZ [Paracoccus rhizosphaerae]